MSREGIASRSAWSRIRTLRRGSRGRWVQGPEKVEKASVFIHSLEFRGIGHRYDRDVRDALGDCAVPYRVLRALLGESWFRGICSVSSPNGIRTRVSTLRVFLGPISLPAA